MNTYYLDYRQRSTSDYWIGYMIYGDEQQSELWDARDALVKRYGDMNVRVTAGD